MLRCLIVRYRTLARLMLVCLTSACLILDLKHGWCHVLTSHTEVMQINFIINNQHWYSIGFPTVILAGVFFTCLLFSFSATESIIHFPSLKSRLHRPPKINLPSRPTVKDSCLALGSLTTEPNDQRLVITVTDSIATGGYHPGYRWAEDSFSSDFLLWGLQGFCLGDSPPAHSIRSFL